MTKIFSNACDAIGNTPLIQLSRVYDGPGHLFAKMEFVQPGGSVKDRVALRILQDALASGELKSGQPVVEMTSGNTGAGLAVVCNIIGHTFTAFMSAGQSPERTRMLKSLGATVELIPQVDGEPGLVTGEDIKLVNSRSRTYAEERGAFYVDQFNRPGSVSAHFEGTGPEIWSALDGKLDAFVASVGSGGTFLGTSKFLKSKKKSIECIPVEPQGSEILAGKTVYKSQHLLQGMGFGLIPPLWDKSIPDSYLAVSDEEAQMTAQALAYKEGLYVGFSAAANVAASIRWLRSQRTPKTCVTILCDTGLKYHNRT